MPYPLKRVYYDVRERMLMQMPSTPESRQVLTQSRILDSIQTAVRTFLIAARVAEVGGYRTTVTLDTPSDDYDLWYEHSLPEDMVVERTDRGLLRVRSEQTPFVQVPIPENAAATDVFLEEFKLQAKSPMLGNPDAFFADTDTMRLYSFWDKPIVEYVRYPAFMWGDVDGDVLIEGDGAVGTNGHSPVLILLADSSYEMIVELSCGVLAGVLNVGRRRESKETSNQAEQDS